ncbi:1-acyl-sn-glycerol-3-phosphate acyltransferase [Anaplasmataceae bacterium AB001_6]|nr:1-acyl-sn-glycerol-3-phosphate acyltransferase [Anaplasmataceae bacterium AB001_6]
MVTSVPIGRSMTFFRVGCNTKKMPEINYHLHFRNLCNILTKITNIKTAVEGLEHIPNNKDFIIASNHESSGDILILANTFKKFPVFLAKKTLFFTPLGISMRNQHIPVNKDSSSITDIKETYMHCKDRVKRGKTIILFPEGTRNHNQKKIEYKPGVFYIAKKTNTVVLPVAHHSSDLMGRNFFHMPKSGTIKIKCLKAIDPATMDKETFLQKLQEVISINVKQLHEDFQKNKTN